MPPIKVLKTVRFDSTAFNKLLRIAGYNLPEKATIYVYGNGDMTNKSIDIQWEETEPGPEEIK
jgi:hypothetical protein